MSLFIDSQILEAKTNVSSYEIFTAIILFLEFILHLCRFISQINIIYCSHLKFGSSQQISQLEIWNFGI